MIPTKNGALQLHVLRFVRSFFYCFSFNSRNEKDDKNFKANGKRRKKKWHAIGIFLAAVAIVSSLPNFGDLDEKMTKNIDILPKN